MAIALIVLMPPQLGQENTCAIVVGPSDNRVERNHFMPTWQFTQVGVSTCSIEFRR